MKALKALKAKPMKAMTTQEHLDSVFRQRPASGGTKPRWSAAVLRNNKVTGNEVKNTQVKDKEVKAGSEVKDNQVKDKEKEADNKMKDNGASASQSSASSQATLYLGADTQVVVEGSQAEDGHVY